jgi:HEAT repeat protein
MKPLHLIALTLALTPLAACKSTGPSNAGANDSEQRSGAASNSVAVAGSINPRDQVAVSQLREQAIDLLLRATTSGQPEFRANAIEGLLSAPSRLKPVLPVALSDASAGVRTVAALAAGRLKAKDNAAALTPLRSDSSPFVRAAAIYALVRIGEPVDPTPLSTMLRDPDTRVRAHAAFVLGELGNSSALKMLRDASGTSSPRSDPTQIRIMQLQIAEAMVKLGDERAVSEIRAALYPASPQDLEAATLAAQIIGQVRDQSSRGELILLTTSNDQQQGRYPAETRLAAAGALAKLGNPRGGFIAKEYSTSPIATQRAQSALVYGETRLTEHLAPLATLMADADPAVRLSAAAAILKITENVPLNGSAFSAP